MDNNLRQDMQETGAQEMPSEDLNEVIIKLARFLFKKNLLEEFKNEHQQETLLISNIEHHITPPQHKRKPKGSKKKPKQKEVSSEEEVHSEKVLPTLQTVVDLRWRVIIKEFEQFRKNEYYVFEECYYKLKSVSLTKFHFHFKLDMVNTRNNRREQLIITNSKRIYWASTCKTQVVSEGGKYFVSLPSEERVFLDNPVHLSAIRKYWDKAVFYAVVPTTLNNQPLPQLIFIEFNY